MKRNAIFILFAVLAGLFFVSAQQSGEISYKDISIMPDGKKGERIQSLISAVNSNDPDKISLFIQTESTPRLQRITPLDQLIRNLRQFYLETGGVDFHAIRSYQPERKNETIVIIKDRNFDSWRAFTSRFDQSEDALVDDFSLNFARTPTNVTEPPLSEKDIVAEVRNIFERLSQKEAYSGTVLVAKGDRVLFSGAAGEASKRFHVPNNIDTKFNLGSMNKMFTSITIMKLVESGKLSLDDPIGKFLGSDWLPEEISSKITTHHLLSHTSGLGSYFNRKFMEGSRELWRALDDYKPLVKDEKPAFEPGTRFSYSNTGMFLLGVIIESVTGEDYFDYIQKAVYQPAGMKNSDCYEMDYPVENLAIGYSLDPDSPYHWQNNLYKHVIKGGPAGGGFSTVKDLHLFALAVLAEKIVSKETLKKMWTDHADSNYGYGFAIDQGPYGKVVGHSGGFSGINSNLDIFLDSGYIVAVMSNVDNGASPFARKIKQLLGRIESNN